MRINYKSDFKLIELSTVEDSSTPFKFSYRTEATVTPYIASFDGSTYKNCRRYDDGSLIVAFDDHGLLPGVITVQREYFLTDDDYNDGVCNKITTQRLDVMLVKTESEGTVCSVAVYPDYQQGYSAYQVAVNNGFEGTEEEWLASLEGDALTFDMLTDEQKEELRGEDGAPGAKGDTGTVELMSFKVVAGYLYVSIPDTSNISFKINEQGELVASWQ